MALKLAYGDDGFELWGITHIDGHIIMHRRSGHPSHISRPPKHVTDLAQFVEAARDAGIPVSNCDSDATSLGFVSFGQFTMDASVGLAEAVLGKGKNASVETAWICAPFEVLGACRDPQGRGWGQRVHFRDADNRVHMRHVSDATLQGEPAALCATLADEVEDPPFKAKRFCGIFKRRSGHRRAGYVNRTGWHEVGGHPVFVLPSEAIAADQGVTVLLDQIAMGHMKLEALLKTGNEVSVL